MSRNLIIAGTALVLVFGSMSVFNVGESQKAIKFRLGEIVETDFKPGLHFQIPFLNNVKKFDGRLLTLDSTPALFMTKEKKNVNVDYFAKWKIKDVGKFYTSVSGDAAQANLQLDRIIQSALRSEFSSRTINQVVSEDRAEIRANVIKAANRLINEQLDREKLAKEPPTEDAHPENATKSTPPENPPATERADAGRPGRDSGRTGSAVEPDRVAPPSSPTPSAESQDNDRLASAKTDKIGNKGLGIEIVDIRIIRIDFPKEVSVSVYRRMESERAGVAWTFRARGAEMAERRRAEADREREVILGNAYRDAEIKRGEGDATAAEIYSRAYGKDKDFFAFSRSLTAYKQAFKNEGDTLVLEPNSEFFQYFKKSNK